MIILQEWAASIEHSCTSAIYPEREASYTLADHQERDRKLTTVFYLLTLVQLYSELTHSGYKVRSP